MLRRTGKSAPWVLSDIKTYDNVRKLWKEGCNVQLFNIDGPQELLRIGLERDPTQHPRPYRRGTHLMWWVRIYLRERIMADNLEKILPCYARQKEAIPLDECQISSFKADKRRIVGLLFREIQKS